MFRIKILETDNKKIAVCESEKIIISDGQSALDFAVNTGYGLYGPAYFK